jgi:hypothetical protein
LPVNIIALVLEPLQNIWSNGAVTLGAGSTFITKVLAGPGQPLAVGVMVMVELICALVLLVAVNTGIVFEPEAPKPIAVLLFVQL